jgi:hypothetical protein
MKKMYIMIGAWAGKRLFIFAKSNSGKEYFLNKQKLPPNFLPNQTRFKQSKGCRVAFTNKFF